jgi:hypothetical protein
MMRPAKKSTAPGRDLLTFRLKVKQLCIFNDLRIADSQQSRFNSDIPVFFFFFVRLETTMQVAETLTPQKSARNVYRAVRDVLERNGVWPVIGHGNDG